MAETILGTACWRTPDQLTQRFEPTPQRLTQAPLNLVHNAVGIRKETGQSASEPKPSPRPGWAWRWRRG